MSFNNLDLQEQEQIANLKAFWTKYGNFILTLIIVVLAVFAGRNGWEWWQRREAAMAVVSYEKLEKAVADKNQASVKEAVGSLLENSGRTSYAQMGALLAAKSFYDAGDLRQAAAQLQWVVDHGRHDEYVATARIRLAGVLLDEGKLDEALSVVSVSVPKSFEGLIQDRKGDVLFAQKKNELAIQAYTQAVTNLADNPDWQDVVQMKLDALTVQ